MLNSLVVMDGSPSTALRVSRFDDVGSELRALALGRNADIAFSLICYLRDPQLGRPFEVYLFQLTGKSVEDFMWREGADSRIRERILQGDELVRARYVMQLLYRYFEFGMEALLKRDLSVMCTVALGEGDAHNFQYGAEQLRQLIRSSPRLSEMLGLPRMLEHHQSAAAVEDTSQYFRFLHEPWYLRFLRFLFWG